MNKIAVCLGKKIVKKYNIGQDNPDILIKKYIQSLDKAQKEIADFIGHKLNRLDKRRISKILLNFAREFDDNAILYDENKYKFYIQNKLSSDETFLDFAHTFITPDTETLFSPEKSMIKDKKIIH